MAAGLAAGAVMTGGAVGATAGAAESTAAIAGSAAMAAAATAIGTGTAQITQNANKEYRRPVIQKTGGTGIARGTRKKTKQWNGKRYVTYTWEYNGNEWLYWNGKSWARGR
jgi:acyl-coenzyme A thioesterase PaaI-like protein